ncbi:DUF6207 family protein [Streptomyces sp. NPDC002181]|uniref:DUF6207 family protein n=1 Tax=Streptomyces sp. NPDC002181 TaxID=3364635 RepID=UPI0036BED283
MSAGRCATPMATGAAPRQSVPTMRHPRPGIPRASGRGRPSANRSGPNAVAGLMKPIDEQHVAEPGLVVLDITGGDEDTVRAVMAALEEHLATSGFERTVRWGAWSGWSLESLSVRAGVPGRPPIFGGEQDPCCVTATGPAAFAHTPGRPPSPQVLGVEEPAR